MGTAHCYGNASQTDRCCVAGEGSQAGAGWAGKPGSWERLSPTAWSQPYRRTSAPQHDLSPIAGPQPHSRPQPYSRPQVYSRASASQQAPQQASALKDSPSPQQAWASQQHLGTMQALAPHHPPHPLKASPLSPHSPSSAPPLPALLLRMRTASRPAAAQAQCCPLAAARRACRGCGGGCAECGAAGWGCGAGAVAMQGAYRGMLSQAEPCEHTGGCKRSGGRQ